MQRDNTPGPLVSTDGPANSHLFLSTVFACLLTRSRSAATADAAGAVAGEILPPTMTLKAGAGRSCVTAPRPPALPY